jgi:epoxyqueuosine reductase QueG
MNLNREDLTAQCRKIAISNGVVLFGVAPVERFQPMPPYYDEVPKGQHPKDFLPTAKSVISMSVPILNAALDSPARLNEMQLEMYPESARSQWLEAVYNRICHYNQNDILLSAAQFVGQHLLVEGYDAMIFPTESVHFPNEDELMKESKFGYLSGPISHRHCATRAGLGEFGYHNLVLTPQFGTRQRFTTIVTEAELEPSPLITKPICLSEKCGICLKACYRDAISLRDDASWIDYRTVEKIDNDVIFIDTPSKTSPARCRDHSQDIQGKPFIVRGDCMRVCPLPKLPRNLSGRLQGIVDEWHRGLREQMRS